MYTRSSVPVVHRLGFRDTEEFTRIVTPEIPAMLRSAHSILGSEDLAWDAVQDVLLRLWRLGWPSERAPAVLRRYAILSALHLTRCQGRRRRHEDLAASSGPCCSEDPLSGVHRAELRAELRSVLARLTQVYREVFELYEFEGYDYREIAAVLAIPLGTVRSRLARARRELGERLSPTASCS